MSTNPVADVVIDDPVMPIKFVRRYSQLIARQQQSEIAQWNSLGQNPEQPPAWLPDGGATGYDPDPLLAPHTNFLGTGWTHNFNEHLRFFHYSLGVEPEVIWEGPDGRDIVFQQVPGSTTVWRPTGRLEVLRVGGPTPSFPDGRSSWDSYELDLPDGTVKYFAREKVMYRFAYLSSIWQQAYGEWTYLRYFGDSSDDNECLTSGTSTPAGQLCKIQTFAGRAIYLTYDSSGRITSLTGGSGGPTFVTFDYSAGACATALSPRTYLSAGCDPNGLGLCCVQKGASVVAYHYSAWAEEAIPGVTRLTRVDDSEGALHESQLWNTQDQVVETDSPDSHLTLSYTDTADCTSTIAVPPLNVTGPDGGTTAIYAPGDAGWRTKVTNLTQGGWPACRYFDAYGYLVKADATSSSCSCDSHETSWNNLPTFQVDSDGGYLPQPNGRTQAAVTEETGRYTSHSYDSLQREALVDRHAPVADQSAYDSETEWTSYTYFNPFDGGLGMAGSSGDGVVAAEYSHSIGDAISSTSSTAHSVVNLYAVGDTVDSWPRPYQTLTTGVTWSVSGGTTTSKTRTDTTADEFQPSSNGEYLYTETQTTHIPYDDSNRVVFKQYYASSEYGGPNDGRLYYTTTAGGFDRYYADYNVFGSPGQMTDENGEVWTYTYDGQGRPLTAVNSADPSASTTTTYTNEGKVSTVTTPTSVVRSFYGGGTVLTLQSYPVAQTAGMLTATERDDASGGPDFLERSETAYYPDGPASTTTYGNKPYITRTLGPSIRDSGGHEISCHVGSGRCGSDADCAAGTVCILGQGGGMCAVAYPTTSSQDPCLASGTALCREGRCHQVLSGTRYTYQDTGTAHVVTTSRVYGDTSSNFPASVHTRTDGIVTDSSSEVVHQTIEQEGARAIITNYDSQHRPLETDLSIDGGTPTVLSTTTYDVDGTQTTTVNEADGGVMSSRRYDDFGNLIEVSSPDMGTVYYEYNEAGDVVKKQNADGAVTTYEYDTYGRVTEIDYPANSYGADGGSPLVGAYSEYFVYDGTDSNVETDCATGSNVAWPINRHAAGRLTLAVVDGSFATWLSYDVAGRIAQRVEQRAGQSCVRVTSYTYDSAGRLSTLVYPSGRMVQYAYNGSDPTRPSDISAKVDGRWVYLASNIQYAGGLATNYVTDTGVVNTASALLTGEPASRQSVDSVGNIISSRNVTKVDGQGNPLQITGATPADEQDFTYDNMNALSTALRPDAGPGSAPYTSIAYTVDGSLEANRLEVVQAEASSNSCGAEETRTSVYSYNSGSNQLAMITASEASSEYLSHFTYDSQGNTVRIDQLTCASGDDWATCLTGGGSPSHAYQMYYDEAGHMVAWEDKTNPTAAYGPEPVDAGMQFGYDYRDLRLYKNNAGIGADTEFYYTDDGALLSETTSAGAGYTVTDYVWIGGQLVGVVHANLPSSGAENDSAAAVYFAHPGLLGEPLRLTDGLGSVAWAGDHDPFGNKVPSGSVTLNIGLPGQYWDSESSSWYNWYRSYIGQIGRYQSIDPLRRVGIGNVMGEYSYVWANPEIFVDPGGASFGSWLKGVAAAIAQQLAGELPKNPPSVPPECPPIVGPPGTTPPPPPPPGVLPPLIPIFINPCALGLCAPDQPRGPRGHSA